MILTITRKGFTLDDITNFKELKAEVHGLTHDELASLATGHPEIVARVGPSHVWIATAYLMEQASNHAPQTVSGVEAMLRFATEHGWVDSAGQTVRAHIEPMNALDSPAIEARTIAADRNAANLVFVGLGAQGSGIARNAVDLGHQIIGAVDVGGKIGQPIGDVIGRTSSETTSLAGPVSGSVDQVLATVTEQPDVAIIAATVDRDHTIEMMKQWLQHGINVLTLHQDLFTYEPAWADELDQFCRNHDVSAMAVGVQDTWWVQLPAIIASSSIGVTKVSYNTLLSVHQVSQGVRDEIGIGMAPPEFEQLVQSLAGRPSVMGGPMTEAARRMGLTPGAVQHDYTYQLSDHPVELDSGKIIEPGQATGTYETVRFMTDEGIEFEGIIQVVPIPLDQAGDTLKISGNPDLHVEYRPFPGEELTNIGLLNRIPDIINAAPGLHFSAELPPARHQLPRTPVTGETGGLTR